jgi:hypothetical protein
VPGLKSGPISEASFSAACLAVTSGDEQKSKGVKQIPFGNDKQKEKGVFSQPVKSRPISEASFSAARKAIWIPLKIAPANLTAI